MRIGTNGPAVAGEEVHGRAVGPGVEARAERHGRWHPPLQRWGGCKKLQLDPAPASPSSGWRGRSVAGWVAHGRHHFFPILDLAQISLLPEQRNSEF